MIYTNDNTGNTFFGFAFVVIAVLIIILMLYLNVIITFIRERKYIKMEMERSRGDEYYYWKRELRKLYISKIPVVRSIVRQKNKR